MEWRNLFEPLCCKLAKECNAERNFKREDEIMSFCWSDEGAKKLLSLWLEERYMKKESKSCAKAMTYKAVGNKEFQEKNYLKSVKSYTKSALYAPAVGDEISLAIANRSAALFYLDRYNDCISDIKLAFMLSYPEKLHHKLYMRLAQCYLKLGKKNLFEETIGKVREVINNPNGPIYVSKDDIEKRIGEMTLERIHTPCVETASSSVSSQIKPEVVFGKNSNFPSATVGIDRKYTKNKGRHVIANRFIKKGDILFLEKPASFVLLQQIKSNTLCQYCCSSCMDVPVPCRMCLDTLYCSIECSKNSWSSFHRWECPGNQIGLWKEIGIAHLALKVLLTCTTTTDRIMFNEMQKLITNFDKVSRKDLVAYAVIATMLTIYLSEYTDFFKVNDLQDCLANKFLDKTLDFSCDISTVNDQRLYVSSLLLRHILQLISNAHTITKVNVVSDNDESFTEEQEIVATGIYPSASIMNHSCDPNIINIFMDQYLIVRASKDIGIGEEVFNCYGPNYRQMLREQRQEALKSQYCFTCECKACTLPELRYFLERFSAVKCFICDGAICNIDNWLHCLDCGNTDINYDKREIQRADEIFSSAQVCIDLGNNYDALNKLKECLTIRRAVLYKYNDDITATLNLMGQVYALRGQWLDCISCIDETFPAISERFGPSSVQFLSELNELVNMCIRYLHEETDTTAKSYKRILKKTQTYLDQIEEITNFNYGCWSSASKRIQKRKEEHCMRLVKHLNV